MLPAHATFRLTNILLRKTRITAYTCIASHINGFSNQAVNELTRTTSKLTTEKVSKISGRAIISRAFSSEPDVNSSLDNATYERVCVQTLDALCDYFEELTENATQLRGSDVSYGDGVLTVNLGNENGTYVINRQSPNKQIWLSSPTSGPKRYDFVGPSTAEHGKWIYKHSGVSLHELLQAEIPKILKGQPVNFLQLAYSS